MRYPQTLVVNLFAAAGVGKSTTMAGLFYVLKRQGIECEMAPEYCKELVWEQSSTKLRHQGRVVTEQWYRISRLQGQVPVVITDSPLLLGMLYPGYGSGPELDAWLAAEFRRPASLNVLLNRPAGPYQPDGRNQTETEAAALHAELRRLLMQYQVAHRELTVDDRTVLQLAVWVREALATLGES